MLLVAVLALALPVAAASPAAAAPTESDWLGWTNLYRAQAGLSALTENATFSTEAAVHAQ